MAGLVDVWVPDLKFCPGSMRAVRAGAPDYFEAATRAIDRMRESVGRPVWEEDGTLRRGVLVRHVGGLEEEVTSWLRVREEEMVVSLQPHLTDLGD